MTDEEKVIRAHEAERLLANPVLIEAFAEIRASIIRDLDQVAMGDAATLLQLHMGLKMTDRLSKVLTGFINTGRQINATNEFLAQQGAEERSIDEELNRRLYGRR